jgi:hypothetical protein
MTDNYLFIVCRSGKGIKYNLLSLAHEKFMIEKSLIKIGMNPTGRYLWTINDSNNLNIWDLEENRKLDFDKKDIWTLVWSENNNSDLSESDDQLNFAYMEKNLYFCHEIDTSSAKYEAILSRNTHSSL